VIRLLYIPGDVVGGSVGRRNGVAGSLEGVSGWTVCGGSGGVASVVVGVGRVVVVVKSSM